MTRLALLAASAAALVMVAPAAPVPTHLMPKDAVAFYPTAVGTTLVYDLGRAEMTIVVTKADARKDGTAVTTELRHADGSGRRNQTVLVSPRGLDLLTEEGEDYAPPLPMLKLPFKPGMKWDTSCTRGNGLKVQGVETAEQEEVVAVPAGKFKAVRVVWDWNQTVTYWYAPRVGLVKMQYGEITSALKSFTPGKP